MGLTSSAYDFSAAFFGILISYLGSGRYKPRWLTASAVFMVVGSVTMAIPHFTTGLYEWGGNAESTCDRSVDNTTSTEVCVASGLQNYVGLFALSNVFFGIGGATLYTVGTAYIDDSVTSLMSPLYLGIYFGFAALGPGIGFIVGGVFLDIYVDADKVDTNSISLETTDLRWVGAWWIGPIFSAVLFVVAALAMSCFGAELPTSKAVRETRESQMHKGTGTKTGVVEPSRPELKTVHKVLWALLRNPPFLFTTLAGITESMFITGWSVFGAKYLQNAFRISSATSGLFSGAAIILGLAGGIVFGGLFCRCFRLKVKGMLRFSFGVCVISLFCLPMLWMSCGQTTLAGVHTSYQNSSKISLNDDCNLGCQCTTERFEISCDSSGVQYFSPCHAGCTRTYNESNSEYSECSCVARQPDMTVSELSAGRCESSCSLVYPFVVLTFLYAFLTIAADVPAEQAVLRSIHENHRTIMCGSNRFFVRLLGTVPGAVIMGVATDAGCLIWQTECGENTSCWLYDISIVSRNYFIFGVVSKLLSACFFFCALWFYKPPKTTEFEVDTHKDIAQTNNAFEAENKEQTHL
ncbi:solute carrier organic anion transporter family member 4A1-like isoform X2 [Mercenaria mercenaria]|nr:solute carrier organic anion transporter family member 4A1-like isoform X2 [Mercenaria mercenaria]